MIAAARIGIDDVDQLADRVLAVADDVGRLAARGGHDFAADHQHAVIVSRREFFHQHVFAFLLRRLESLDDLLSRRKIRGHAAALIAVLRLHDHGHADVAGGFPGVFGARDGPAFGSGHADRAEQHPRQFFILGKPFGNGRRAIGLRGLDAALLAAVAELHQTAIVQAADGNVAGFRGGDDRAGARAKANLMRHIAQPLDFAGNVERPVVHGGEEQFAGDFQALAAQRLPRHSGRPRDKRPLRRFRGPCRSRPACRPAIAIPSVICSRIWAGYVPIRRRWKKPPRSPMLQRCSIIVGSQLISRSLKPGISLEGESFKSPRSTQASITGKLAQIFGPRNASTLRNSIVDFLDID